MTRRLTAAAFITALIALGVAERAFESRAAAQAQVVAPRFEVDPLWPKPLPNHWVVGMMVGVSIDSHDHVFIIHRPRSLSAIEIGAAGPSPTAGCCVPAPPVIEFDPDGNVVNAWGGDAPGYDWPNGVGAAGEHGISVDAAGNV
jgi:hypothetical protein